MFEPTFDPYSLLMELLDRTHQLETTNQELVKALNQHGKMLNSLSSAHMSLAKQHQELVKYITDKELNS